jgi:hypothetical protein
MLERGKSGLQNMTQEQIDHRSINMRLALMKNGLVQWDENFKKFIVFDSKMPTQREFSG